MHAIVQRSAVAVTFIGLLGLPLSAPQQRHLERLADLLVVTPWRKTLAELAAGERHGVDPSNLADFFRISPWEHEQLRRQRLWFILQDLKARNRGRRQPIYLLIDDSLATKDKGTQHLEPVGLVLRPQGAPRGACQQSCFLE